MMLFVSAIVLMLIAPVLIVMDKLLGWVFQVVGLWIITYMLFNPNMDGMTSTLILFNIVWVVCTIIRFYKK